MQEVVGSSPISSTPPLPALLLMERLVGVFVGLAVTGGTYIIRAFMLGWNMFICPNSCLDRMLNSHVFCMKVCWLHGHTSDT